MLGLGDLAVALAVWSCIGVTLVGVVYGAFNWNRGDDGDQIAAEARLRRRNRRNRRRR
ncbi:MAG: hypothetical protein PHI35_02650 [Victivallaceae bacterium]|nr:hypothetical protein [Victivallaceae bacterium]